MWVPFEIKVRNGSAVSREPTEEVKELTRTDGYDVIDTVEKLFDVVENACRRGDNVIAITYNLEQGYPERIRIDPKDGGIDAGYSIRVSKLVVISDR